MEEEVEMGLSPEGRRLLGICNSAAEAVFLAIEEWSETPPAARVIHMGADGTPPGE